MQPTDLVGGSERIDRHGMGNADAGATGAEGRPFVDRGHPAETVGRGDEPAGLGDLVVFDQNDDGSLFLKPAPTAASSTAGIPYLVEARSFDTPGLLERLVVGAYRVGHDSIEIRTEVALGPERIEELQQAARRLLGVSVVAQEPNRVLLQNFIDPSKYELPQLVQRMKMILVASIEESEALLAQGARSGRLTSLSEETNRVLALMVRQLFLASRDWSLARRIGSSDPRQAPRVEGRRLRPGGARRPGRGDRPRAQRGRPGPKGTAPPLPQLLTEFEAGLTRVVDTLMRPSLPSACSAFSESVRLAESARVAARKSNGSRRRQGLHTALLAIQRSAACLSLLSEVALDRAVSTGSVPAIPRAE